jgi:hypothetical protein
MAKLKKPKGAYPKVAGVGGVEFTGKTKAEKFENYFIGIRDTQETRKDRFEDTSRLYAAARKIGLSQKSVKPQIDAFAKQSRKWAGAGDKEAFKLDAEDMQRRSAENAKLKAKKAAAKAKPVAKKTTAKKAAVKLTVKKKAGKK